MTFLLPIHRGQLLWNGGVLTITTEKQNYESATCAHCGGIGCLYCNKSGVVLVTAPKRQCHHCEGVGCIYCGFTGWADPKGKYH
jgi:hypothetical protein